jgi:hypothetical protein
MPAVFSRRKRFATLLPSLCSIASITSLFRARLVDSQGPTIEKRPIESLNCRVCFGVVGHFDKRKATLRAGITIRDQGDRGNDPMRSEQLTELSFSRGDVQIADKNMFHTGAPAATFASADVGGASAVQSRHHRILHRGV